MSECGTLRSFYYTFKLIREIQNRLSGKGIVSFSLEEECILKTRDGGSIVGYGLAIQVVYSEQGLITKRIFSISGEIVPSDMPEEEFIHTVVDDLNASFRKAMKEKLSKALRNSHILQSQNERVV